MPPGSSTPRIPSCKPFPFFAFQIVARTFRNTVDFLAETHRKNLPNCLPNRPINFRFGIGVRGAKPLGFGSLRTFPKGDEIECSSQFFIFELSIVGVAILVCIGSAVSPSGTTLKSIRWSWVVLAVDCSVDTCRAGLGSSGFDRVSECLGVFVLSFVDGIE